MHAERGNYQWPPCPACRCVACSWSCAGSVVTQSSLVTPSPHVHLRNATHKWAWLPIYRQIISKGLEDSRCGHWVRECVQSAILWTDCELGVPLVDEQRTLPTFHGCTQTLFQIQRLWRGSLRGEAPTIVGTTRQLTKSDSLAQGRTWTLDTRPRCDLQTVRHE